MTVFYCILEGKSWNATESAFGSIGSTVHSVLTTAKGLVGSTRSKVGSTTKSIGSCAQSAVDGAAEWISLLDWGSCDAVG